VTAPTDAADLYGLPLEEFTAARNALAKQLAKAGDKAGAEAVKRLPKPSKPAWALNQLARRHPEDVEQLLAAGERLREAQQRALAGDATQLRAATRAEQSQVDRLLDVAADLLGGAGPAAAARDRLRSTLRAAANDPSTGMLLREGRLVAEADAAGFGLEGLPDVLPDLGPIEPEAAAAAGEDDGEERERAQRQEEARARRQAHRDAQREAERLQRDAQRLHDRAVRLVEHAELAERRAREAREEADAAVQAADEAERRAVDAAGVAASLEPR
jgi:hypothetical protein